MSKPIKTTKRRAWECTVRIPAKTRSAARFLARIMSGSGRIIKVSRSQPEHGVWIKRVSAPTAKACRRKILDNAPMRHGLRMLDAKFITVKRSAP